MFFNEYTQFISSNTQLSTFNSSSQTFDYIQPSKYNSQAILTSDHDLVYSQFTQVISKRLVSWPYPQNLQYYNIICPLCLRFVFDDTLFTTCYINNQRNYLIHQECLLKNRSYQLRNVGQLVQNSIVLQQTQVSIRNKFQRGLDSRNFYLEVTMSHPINQKNFIKINQKTKLIRDYFHISINETETNSYFPNLILLPLSDYHLIINLHEIGTKNNQSKIVRYISFKIMNSRKRANMKCDNITLEAQIIYDYSQKMKLIQSMNYKYKYPVNQIPIVRIHGFKINIPQQFEQSDQDQLIGSTNIVQQLLKQEQFSQSHSSFKPIQSNNKKKNNLIDSNSTHELQNQKINITKLINSNSLVQFVKNNNQSRNFQNYLSQSNPEEVQQIIIHISDRIPDLIMHEYGNYMIQKLFSVCSSFQRLQILQAISNRISEIAKNKQGTHTIQAFIQYFTSPQQFTLIILSLNNDFYQLCKHNNATHFIQKIVKTFPLDYTLGFFQYITQNLIAFALDKNAMCVIKHMMRRLRELEGSQPIYDQKIDNIRKHLLLYVTFAVDKLIIDGYGNYVIQFCYQMFDLHRCSGITEIIISRFHYYSMDKFASNVLLKCVTTYWTDKNIFQSLRYLTYNQIIQIFRNKDGNKILLQIMQKLEGTQLWDHFYTVLVQVQPTRFYHDRWGICLGIRSGQVGTHHTFFPEPKKKVYKKKY